MICVEGFYQTFLLKNAFSSNVVFCQMNSLIQVGAILPLCHVGTSPTKQRHKK